MAITFSAYQSTISGTTSVTVTTPVAPGGGALSSSNIIFALALTTGSSSEWAGYAAAGWTRVFWEPGATSRLHVLWRRATASEPANYTLGAYTSAGLVYGVMFSCAGIDTTTPVHLFASDFGSTNSTTAVCPTISPTITTAMLFWLAGNRGNVMTNASSATSTGTELFDVNGGATDSAHGVLAGYYEQLSASGATGTRTVTYTQSGSSRAMGTLALNPAAVSTMTEWVGMVPIG